MKRILINATQLEELRVAIVDGQRLYNLDIEVPSREQKKSSIFKGKITRVEPSLEAAFVDYGAERHGFLPFKEIVKDYWKESAQNADKRPSIKDAVQEGQEVIVQVEKEERGNKGAALTTKISLAGRYLVLMPTEPRAGGVSRRIEGEERNQVREALNQINKPEDFGVIIRTAGVDRSVEELQWDIDYLITLWQAILDAAEKRPAPFLIYHDSSVIIRALRDHYDRDIGQILIDNPEIYQQAEDFVRQVMPHNLRKLKLYEEAVPLFSRFQIESQIESAFQREVQLPSGGAIVIDHTEALTSIDVNSARATKGSDIEETALQTNLEAVDEICRQLRLRDLGGLFVIDFIDMIPNKNQREVENRLRQTLRADRARVRISRISRFGLLEMSRQRLRPSLGESSAEICQVCNGHGTIRSVESLSLSILRLIEEECNKENTSRILAHLPVDVATFLLNEKRTEIGDIETRQQVQVVMVPDHNYDRPNFQLERVRSNEKDHSSENKSSFELIEEKSVDVPITDTSRNAYAETAAVKTVPVSAPVPVPSPNGNKGGPEQPGLFVRLWKGLFSTGSEAKVEKEEPARQQNRNTRAKGGNQRNQNKRQDGQDNRRQNQNQRGDRNNSGNRSRGNKNNNRKRNNQQQNQQQSKNEQQKQNKPQQKNKPANQQDNKKPAETADPDGNTQPRQQKSGDGQQNQNNRGRKRNNRRRGGRNRKPSDQQQTQNRDNAQNTEANGNVAAKPPAEKNPNGNVKATADKPKAKDGNQKPAAEQNKPKPATPSTDKPQQPAGNNAADSKKPAKEKAAKKPKEPKPAKEPKDKKPKAADNTAEKPSQDKKPAEKPVSEDKPKTAVKKEQQPATAAPKADPPKPAAAKKAAAPTGKTEAPAPEQRTAEKPTEKPKPSAKKPEPPAAQEKPNPKPAAAAPKPVSETPAPKPKPPKPAPAVEPPVPKSDNQS